MPVVVPFINSDQMLQEEKITGKCFQITKRNVKHIFKFLDIYGHRSIFSRQLNLFQDCFSCSVTILRDFFFNFADEDNLCFSGKKLSLSLHD